VNWRGVRAATPQLERLVERLREDPGVRVQGIARARLLLTDADSALYAKDDDLRLADEVRSTLALL
jgi:RecB family endonuclease NucS